MEKFTHGKEWNYEQIADERVIRSLAQRWLIPEDMRWDIRREWKPYVIAMFGSWEVFEQLEVASGEEDFDRLLFDVSRDMEKGGSLTDDLQDRFHNCTHMRRNPLKLCNLDFVRGYAKKMRELFHKKRCWILSDEERPEFPQLLWVEKQEIHLLRVQLGGDGFFYERLRKNYRDDTRREVSQAEVQSLIQNRFGKGGHSLPQLHLPHIAHPTLSTSVKSNIKSAGHAVKTVAKGVGRVTLDILDALGDIDFGDD